LDHSTHQPLDRSELTEANLVGAPIYGPENTKIGSVSHMHGSDANTQVIIDVGSFLGIGARPIGLSVGELNWMRDDNGNVHATTSWTKEQIKALPEHQ